MAISFLKRPYRILIQKESQAKIILAQFPFHLLTPSIPACPVCRQAGGRQALILQSSSACSPAQQYHGDGLEENLKIQRL